MLQNYVHGVRLQHKYITPGSTLKLAICVESQFLEDPKSRLASIESLAWDSKSMKS